MSDNIQVIVRCRSRNEREIASNSPSIIGLSNDVYSLEEPFVSVNNTPMSLVSSAISSSGIKSSLAQGKVFKVDQVYGPNADQALLFENVALPLFHDFVNGLNVTILAYGQTGSGKTYTMCGDLEGENAGMIPRVLNKLFDVLSGDYCVKLSCVELYKEELRDLNSDDPDVTANKSKLRLVNDNSRKSATIQNLTEVPIDNSAMGFQILQRCLNKRKTGATKMNDISSRSHTVFTINIYKQANPSDCTSDYRVSKMNLVDLAGSEDVNKSGAINERAREAGSINQSLLTLGKVINSLSEGKEPKHIPYRESKLTRLLQGSIGGKTKTALIAAISPAKINAHETISTLNYASKAKDIKNIPQSTQDSEMVLKKVLVADLSSQIARVTRDLLASRDREGNIKMSVQNYDDYNKKLTSMESNLIEKNAEVQSMMMRMTRKEDEIQELQKQLKEAEALKDVAIAQLAKKNDEVGSLELQFSTLKEKYAIRNEQLAEVMLLNISDINDNLARFQRSIMDDKSLIGSQLESLKIEMVHQVQQLKTNLRKRGNEVQQLIRSELDCQQTAILKSLDVSPYLGQISKFDLGKPIQSLQDSHEQFSRDLDVILNPDSTPFKAIIERSDSQYLSKTIELKERILTNISSTIEDIFSNNKQAFADSLKLTVSEVLNTGGKRIALILTKHSDSLAPIYDQIEFANKNFKKNLSGLESHLERETYSTIQNTGESVKTKLTSAVELIMDLNLADDYPTKIQKSIDIAKKGLENIGTSTTKNHLRTTGVFNNFRSVLANIDTTPNTTRSIPASQKRSPIGSPVGNSPKRRQQLSVASNSSILHRSQIPQLSHSTRSNV